MTEKTVWLDKTGAVVVHDHGDNDAVTRAMAVVGATDVEVVYAARVTRYIEVAVDRLDELKASVGDATAGRATAR